MRVLGLSTSVSVVYCLFRNFGRLFVARNIEDIQQDIERTRRQLAGTLDRLAYRTRPQTIVEDAKKSALQRLQELKELQRLLSTR